MLGLLPDLPGQGLAQHDSPPRVAASGVPLLLELGQAGALVVGAVGVQRAVPGADT